MWFKETISGFVEEQEEKKMLIHLDKTEQLVNVLEKVEIQAISFDNTNANVAFRVK